MVGNRDVFLDRTKPGYFTFQLNHCGISACRAGYRYGFQLRPYHLIHFILRGSGTFETESQKTALHGGQAFYIPAGSCGTYQASDTDPWTYCWIGFYADSRSPFFSQLFGERQIVDFAMSADEIEQLFLSILSVTDQRFCNAASYNEADYPGEQFFCITEFSESLEANSRLMHLFSRLLETQTVGPGTFIKGLNPAADAKAYLDACYCRPLKIQEAASALHIHPNYLSTVFKKAYGSSPSEYLRSIRMEHSAMLLALTDYPVSAVAQAVGYTSPFQFSAAFKQHFHVSPSAYRKQKMLSMPMHRE